MTIRPGIDISSEALAALCERFHVRELSLFGSSARGDFRSDSDVDLLVEFRPGAVIGFLALAALRRELTDLMGRRVDLVPKLGLKAPIRDEVIGGARLLYAA